MLLCKKFLTKGKCHSAQFTSRGWILDVGAKHGTGYFLIWMFSLKMNIGTETRLETHFILIFISVTLSVFWIIPKCGDVLQCQLMPTKMVSQPDSFPGGSCISKCEWCQMLGMFPSTDGGEEILQSLIKMANWLSVALKKVAICCEQGELIVKYLGTLRFGAVDKLKAFSDCALF